MSWNLALLALALALALASPGRAGADDFASERIRWLARHQGADGGWHARDFTLECPTGDGCDGAGDPAHDRSATGLALLAFLGEGYTHLTRGTHPDPFLGREVAIGAVVRRAFEHLKSLQDEDGCVGPREGEYVLEHAVATLALCEALGLTSAKLIGTDAQRAVRFLESERRKGGAWGARGSLGPADLLTTTFCVMALATARISGLEVGPLDEVRAWLDAGIDPETGLPRDVAADGSPDAAADRASGAAQALHVRVLLERQAPKGPIAERQAALVATSPPAAADAPDAARADLLRWYMCTAALFQHEGPSDRWKAWEKPLRATLAARQDTSGDRCRGGSWAPLGVHPGIADSRVAATALATIMLQFNNRWENVFGAGKRKGAAPAKPAEAPSKSHEKRAPERTPTLF